MRARTAGWAAAGLVGVAGWAAAGEGDEAPAIRFAAPVRLAAGEKLLGQGRYYPSPAVHDLDGDGQPEVLVGDLQGRVTFATRGKAGLGAEQPLLTREKKPLKFDNW